MTPDVEKYVGAPWRSRFLRAPKIGFVLADRGDFVRLGDLADATLGLKTGADKFFFVKKIDEPEADEGHLIKRPRGSSYVEGLDGWRGYISNRDLKTAILNPHQLFEGDGRRFNIPKDTGHLYLYPSGRSTKAELGGYVAFAEEHGIHERRLVSSNASDDRWYCQERKVVSSPWALPYNSAYDFGAWDNSVGAVLNGRFVGVSPLGGIDPELVGAVLNSTYAIVMRLFVGKATGVEGAYDVGPPAARDLLVPDPRKFNESGAERVRAALNEIAEMDVMPGAPRRDASAPNERHRLDVAVGQALGMTKGEASSLVGNMYESYARWRTAVEDVELMMRQHRRVMNQEGQSRGVRPEDLAARRVWEEVQHRFQLFPSDLLTPSDSLEPLDLPRKLPMPKQEPLFDGGKVTTGDGEVVDLGTHDRVRYAAMLASIGFEPPYLIPEDSDKAREVADAFEETHAELRTLSQQHATAYASDESMKRVIVQAVERRWIKGSRQAGMGPSTDD